MAKIVGVDGMTEADLDAAIDAGGRLVVYHYTISVLIMTFRRGSAVHFIPAGESAVVKGLPYSLLSFIAGWWGFPWGPIYTVGSLIKNFSGGDDVTPFGPIGGRDAPTERSIPERPMVQAE